MTVAATLPKTETVTSKDGTTIAFERHGAGPVIVVVDGALCHRAFGPSRPFAERDRQGRRAVTPSSATTAAAGGRAATRSPTPCSARWRISPR